MLTIHSIIHVTFLWFQDMVHVLESKPAKRYGDYFMRQIVKVRAVEANVSIIAIFSEIKYAYNIIIHSMCIFVQLEGIITDIDRIKLEA